MTVTFIYGVILAQVSVGKQISEEQKALVNGLAAHFFPQQWTALSHSLGGSDMGDDNDFWADIGSTGEAVIPGTSYILQAFPDDAGGCNFVIYIGQGNTVVQHGNVVCVPLPSDEEKRVFAEFVLAAVGDEILPQLSIGGHLIIS